MTPITKAVIIISAIIIIAIGTVAGVFYFSYKSEKKALIAAKEQIAQQEKEIQRLGLTIDNKDSQIAIMQEMSENTKKTNEAILAIKEESQSKQRTIDQLISKLKEQEAAGEIVYKECPDTRDIVLMLNEIRGVKYEEPDIDTE